LAQVITHRVVIRNLPNQLHCPYYPVRLLMSNGLLWWALTSARLIAVSDALASNTGSLRAGLSELKGRHRSQNYEDNLANLRQGTESDERIHTLADSDWHLDPLYVNVISAWRSGNLGSNTNADVEHALPRRILLVCVQSSGCGLMAKLLGQIPDVAAFSHVAVTTPAGQFPSPTELDPKGASHVVITMAIQGDDVSDPIDRLRQVKDRLRADRTILVVRHPAVTFERLSMLERYDTAAHGRSEIQSSSPCPEDPPNGAQCGTAVAKLRALERLWVARMDLFDAVVKYDDMVRDESGWDSIVQAVRGVGVPLERQHFLLQKPAGAIYEFARERIGAARFSWSVGNVMEGGVQLQALPTHLANELVVEESCPSLLADYDHVKSQNMDFVPILDADAKQWFAARVDQETGIVTLLFADSAFSSVLLNWLAIGESSKAFRKNNAVVCLDEKLQQTLVGLGHSCYMAPRLSIKDSLSSLWMLRIRILSELLDEGLNVVMTDSDALWLADPLPTFAEAGAQGADIVASRGQCFENRPCKVWGVSACMGFALFRATAASKSVVASMLTLSKASLNFDDQTLLNHVLLYADVEFDSNADRPLQLEGSTQVDVGVSKNSHVSIALLPHQRFPRFCDRADLSQAIVAHCFTDGNIQVSDLASTKKKTLHAFGLWALGGG